MNIEPSAISTKSLEHMITRVFGTRKYRISHVVEVVSKKVQIDRPHLHLYKLNSRVSYFRAFEYRFWRKKSTFKVWLPNLQFLQASCCCKPLSCPSAVASPCYKSVKFTDREQLRAFLQLVFNNVSRRNSNSFLFKPSMGSRTFKNIRVQSRTELLKRITVPLPVHSKVMFHT